MGLPVVGFVGDVGTGEVKKGQQPVHLLVKDSFIQLAASNGFYDMLVGLAVGGGHF